MTKSIKMLMLSTVLISVVANAAQAACWVRNQNGKLYYFKTLCCNKFIIHPEWGEDCYNIPGTCWGAFNDGAEPESLMNGAPEDLPSLSLLKEINAYTVEIKPDGSAVISVEGVSVVTLTSEGISDFFRQSPAVFYESTEKKTSIEHEAIVIDENKERIISVVPELNGSESVVPLGVLNDQQMGMIKRLSEAGKRAPVENYAFKISPNPSSSEVNLNFSLPKSTPATLFVVDISGTVKRQTNYALQSGVNALAIDIQQYSPGTYLILLDFGDGAVSGSFIKQ